MKQVRDFYDQFDTCREHDIPLCADSCPFRLDIIDIQDRITRKRFNAAYKTIRDAVVFPGIVARICPAYCQDSCIRKSFDDPVQIRRLEEAVTRLATRKDPNSYNLPSRNTRVGVIGAGISGMAFALKMAVRKCSVTVFEKEAEIGGCLDRLMDREDYLAEFELQFKHEKYELITGTEARLEPDCGKVVAAGEEWDFDIVYIATGQGGDDFGVSEGYSVITKADGSKTCIFTGGMLKGRDVIHALADGIELAAAADGFMKTGKVEMPARPAKSKCVSDEDMIISAPAVTPQAEVYTEEECIAEAGRCIRCQCNGCETYCDLVEYYEKWPVKMRDEIFLSVKPAGSLVHKCPSRKYIAACTDCKILDDACPENIDLCGMVKVARHQMHEADKMPAAYKQYYVRDMEFANGEFASLVKEAPDGEGTSYAFFPGCNLGALDPEYVLKPYRWLLEKHGSVGLLLKCCGIPIDWAGNTKAHEEEIQKLRSDWEMLGKPVLITACMTCDRHLHEYLPEIETVSIYELMAEDDDLTQTSEAARVDDTVYSVFDPCSARGNEKVQTAVRNIAEKAGLFTEELPKSDRHGCCGFGGQGDIAQPAFTEHVARKRIEAADNPYLVYCSNCRDVFTSHGKDAIHIFDWVFDINKDNTRPAPSLSRRRENRVILKEKLLEEFWGEEMDAKPSEPLYELKMDDQTAAKVEKLHIISDDICSVIERADRTGRRTRNPENGHYKAYNEIGAITLWVEYSIPEGEECSGSETPVRIVHNVYSHRMQIKLEEVFNGKKVDE